MTQARPTEIRIALIGCGAIAQAHAQALTAVAGVRCTVLFDTDRTRAETLRRTYFPEARVADELTQVGADTDAAIVAVPNAYHAPVTIELLRAGLHVLCQKPLATTHAAARAMADEAEAAGRVLACVPTRRLDGATELVIEALQRGIVGRARRFKVRESVWNWPLNRATFAPEVAGGGVFSDMGPHWLAQLNAWFGPLELLAYEDDNRGRVEATARAQLRCHAPHGAVTGEIFLTRATRTANYAQIECDDGTILLDPHEPAQIKLAFGHGAERFETSAQTVPTDPFVRQLQNFVGAIRGDELLVMPTEWAVAHVGLIESCYRTRRPLPEPWAEDYAPAALTAERAPYQKILVTGAAGLIGSRLIELWAASADPGQLRCMVRSYRTAARLLRYEVETVEADLTDNEAVRRAATGCDAIIHLGLGERAERETLPLLKAAHALGIRRFVHMSTAAVYGIGMPARIEARQEEAVIEKTGEPYADQKAAAERAVQRAAARGLEAVILRPHIVYGPYMRWSGELMELLAQGRVPVVEDGGWCNLIYIDDLIAATLRALVVPTGFGQPMFITDGRPITWREYIEAHAALIGVNPPHRTRAEVARGRLSARAWLRASVRPLGGVVRSQEFRAFVFESPAVQATVFRAYLALRDKTLLRPLVASLRGGATKRTTDGGAPFNELWTTLQLSQARLSPARAQALLDFHARIDFKEGLRRSARWFEHYGLTDSAASEPVATTPEPTLVES